MTNETHKSALVNSIAILLSMPSQAAGLSKLSIPVLEEMYSGLLKNANAWQLVQEESTAAKNEVYISRGRIKVLEAEVVRLKKQIKERK